MPVAICKFIALHEEVRGEWKGRGEDKRNYRRKMGGVNGGCTSTHTGNNQGKK
jgi:hypothetical protein